MNRKQIFVANWKMHKTIAQSISFVEYLRENLKSTSNVDVVICSAFTALGVLNDMLKETEIKLGAQNLHQEKEGAFTGEVSAEMLRDVGVEYVIIGHSERRLSFNETNESVNAKVHAALQNGLHPIVCCGENFAQRSSGITNEFIESQVRSALEGINPNDIDHMIIAYEPIWAIGTGITATADEANEVCMFIRKIIGNMFGEEKGNTIRIQYGGSVNQENINELIAQSDIDGVLVGGASLDPHSFTKLICLSLDK